MKIIFTKHADAMLAERDIPREWVERTLRTPDFVEPDPLRPEGTRAFRSIRENGGRMLRVVYVPDGDAVRVVTAFFDRNRSK